MKNKLFYLLSLGLFSVISILFGYLYYSQYYKWIDCFNELGRCYNPDNTGIVYTRSGQIWLFPFTIFTLITIFLLSKIIINSLFPQKNSKNVTDTPYIK